jgi:hypothetical protein
MRGTGRIYDNSNEITHVKPFRRWNEWSHQKNQVLYQLFGSVYNGRKYFACYEVLFRLLLMKANIIGCTYAK